MTIGQHKRDLTIVPYREGWVKCFEEEKARLQRALGEHALQIEHIGSTSIPGMSAKPIIDIMVAVVSLAQGKELVPRLEAIGYIYKPFDTVPVRVYFSKENPPEHRTHHLNLVEPGSDFWANQLAFPEYLQKHDEMAAEYIRLKQRLAEEHARTGVIDPEYKTPFVMKVLEAARQEREAKPVGRTGSSPADSY